MPWDERLLAWIEPRGGGYLAAFVAKAELERRAPAIQQFRSQDEARQWVLKEAEAVRARVEWSTAGTLLDWLPQ